MEKGTYEKTEFRRQNSVLMTREPNGDANMIEAFAVATITIFAVISPGADFAMVTRNSMILSRRAGVLTALGIALGVLVHVSYSMLGIGLLISKSIMLFNTIKLFGAAYLIYLGVIMLRSKRTDLTKEPVGVAALSAGKAVLVVGKEYTGSAPGTELFDSGYGIAFYLVVIFDCHCSHLTLRLRPLHLRLLLLPGLGPGSWSERIRVRSLSCALLLRRAWRSPWLPAFRIR